jgi:pimeloyl-ACP methyl ester carboxylesterase
VNIVISKLLLASSALLAASGNAAPAKADSKADRPAIVLVHGAWQTGDAWLPVAGRLRADGYRVITVNLPGRVGTPLTSSAVSLDLYRDTVIKAISAERRPVVLVGHSFGGVTISNVAESIPERIKTLVYVAAFVPRDGVSLLDMAKTDAGSLLPPHLHVDSAAGMVSVDAASRAAMFANDGTADQQALASAISVDEPLAPLATPIHLTKDRSGKADRVYIKTLRDQAVSPAFQDAMIAASSVRLTLTLSNGHSPFLTNPTGLATAIEEAAR